MHAHALAPRRRHAPLHADIGPAVGAACGLLLALAPLACVPTSTGAPDAGLASIDDVDGDAGSDAVGGDAGQLDAGGGDVIDSGGASVAWSSELPNPYIFPDADDADGVLDNAIAVDFALRYAVVLPTANDPPATLEVKICMQPAGQVAACSSRSDVAVEGDGVYRWGFDPSQYTTGLNIYEHTLTLTQSTKLLATTTLRFEVTAP